MTTKKMNSAMSVNSASLLKPMLIGAGLGLILISLFLLGTGEPNPEWGSYWMARPLIIVPIAGAMGGLCYYLIVHFHKLLGLNKILAIILGLMVLFIGIWLGTVLGLDGTYWD